MSSNTLGENSGREKKSRFFDQVWRRDRRVIVILLSDGIKFLILMALISIGHYIIGMMPVTAERRHFLEECHFWVLVTVWLLFSLVLLLEIIVDSLQRIKERPQAQDPFSGNERESKDD